MNLWFSKRVSARASQSLKFRVYGFKMVLGSLSFGVLEGLPGFCNYIVEPRKLEHDYPHALKVKCKGSEH